MADRNNGARRRKAFADFKENQYNDSFSISDSQKRKIAVKNILKYVLIILITVVFICIGFIFSDALLDISSEKYNDTKVYTPSATTEQESTTLPSSQVSEESNTDISSSEPQ